ncbi:hypothetical protein EXIGLDRAFT_725473 [Exidia glandulosa HHB12029]|uniref:Uncharacterized protein n=1 Tax=Exidia glandulosa HHB12029 TaxID=1314781 RepID=A0A165E185_EXIGL|nr:hypothetical protein EXIGLDRAFT_725473 [Exidia glandulosa HHB12029]
MASVNILWAGNLAQLALDRWGRPVKREDGTEVLELRPLWQRGTLAALSVGVGVTVTSIVFVARSRNVTRILLRHGPTRAESSVLIQAPGTTKNGGRVFSQDACTLSQARAEDEMAIHVRGLALPFWPYLLRFKNSEIPGVDLTASAWERRRAFMSEWDGKQYTIRRVSGVVRQR